MPRLYYPAARAVLTVVFDGFGEDAADSQEFIIPIIVKAATIHRNSYRQADSWEITFDARDLPIDPQQVRAGAAEVYLFELQAGMRPGEVATSRQFATAEEAAAAGGPGGLAQAGAATASARDSFTLDNEPTIVGLFDEQNLEMSDDGKWVTISGQDYTAYLASRQWPPTAGGKARKIPTGQRIDRQLQAILAEAQGKSKGADSKRRLRLKVEGLDEFDLPVVGAAEASTNGRGIPVEASTSYWDVMYKLATRYGCILFVRGLDVVLSRPKNLTNPATADVKQLAWGQNLEKVELKRHLGQEKVPRIVIKAYDHGARKAIIVEYPAQGRKGDGKLFKAQKGAHERVSARQAGRKEHLKTWKTPEKGTAGAAKGPTVRVTDEYQIIPIWGVSDRKVLMQAAENFFHLIGHAERQLTAKTKDLRDLDGRSLLDLNAGDAVEVDWAFDRELLANASKEARYSHLVKNGYGPAVAAAIAEHYDLLIGQKRPMRVHEVTYEYNLDDGLSIELQLKDFVVVDGLRDPDQRLAASKKRHERVRGAKGQSLANPLIEGRK